MSFDHQKCAFCANTWITPRLQVFQDHALAIVLCLCYSHCSTQSPMLQHSFHWSYRWCLLSKYQLNMQKIISNYWDIFCYLNFNTTTPLSFSLKRLCCFLYFLGMKCSSPRVALVPCKKTKYQTSDSIRMYKFLFSKFVLLEYQISAPWDHVSNNCNYSFLSYTWSHHRWDTLHQAFTMTTADA